MLDQLLLISEVLLADAKEVIEFISLKAAHVSVPPASRSQLATLSIVWKTVSLRQQPHAKLGKLEVSLDGVSQ